MAEPISYADYQQRRGVAWDIIEEAINAYDSYMLDDDYDAQRTLNKIIARMKERRALYAQSGLTEPKE